MNTPALRVLSLGAGVQSSALTLLAAHGRIPTFDAAIFADTGWEPAAVYAHLNRLEQHVLAPAGIALHRVSTGNIRNDALNPDRRFATMPLFVRNPQGRMGMAKRQCTSEYKLRPIKARVRRLLGYEHPRRVPRGVFVDQAIGISTDEVARAKDSGLQYMRNVFPLLDLGMSRQDCQDLLAGHGFAATPRSACIGCPFHGNAQWRRLRDTCSCGHHRDDHAGEPAEPLACAHNATGAAGEEEAQACPCPGFRVPEWEDAVDFDRAIRNGSAHATATGSPLRGRMYLHRSGIPLNQAPIDPGNRPLLSLTLRRQRGEHGDPDGCSPWACRSGEPAEAAEPPTPSARPGPGAHGGQEVSPA